MEMFLLILISVAYLVCVLISIIPLAAIGEWAGSALLFAVLMVFSIWGFGTLFGLLADYIRGVF